MFDSVVGSLSTSSVIEQGSSRLLPSVKVEEEKMTEYDSVSNATTRRIRICSANQYVDPCLVGMVGEEGNHSQTQLTWLLRLHQEELR